jgi:hypothetical protein
VRPVSVRAVRPVLVRAGGDLGDQASQAARDAGKNVSNTTACFPRVCVQRAYLPSAACFECLLALLLLAGSTQWCVSSLCVESAACK